MNKCNKKTFYATKSEVRQAKKSIRKRFHSFIKFYKCPDCKGWHLTRSKNNLKMQFDDLELQHIFRKMIQSKQAKFVKRISKVKTVWKVIIGKKGYHITYNKRTKVSKINYCFSANDNCKEVMPISD